MLAEKSVHNTGTCAPECRRYGSAIFVRNVQMSTAEMQEPFLLEIPFRLLSEALLLTDLSMSWDQNCGTVCWTNKLAPVWTSINPGNVKKNLFSGSIWELDTYIPALWFLSRCCDSCKRLCYPSLAEKCASNALNITLNWNLSWRTSTGNGDRFYERPWHKLIPWFTIDSDLWSHENAIFLAVLLVLSVSLSNSVEGAEICFLFSSKITRLMSIACRSIKIACFSVCQCPRASVTCAFAKNGTFLTLVLSAAITTH